MPNYMEGPFPQRAALIPGQPAYSFGVAPTANARMSISKVAIATNVATLTVQMLEGIIPAVGALISVQGTQTVTSGGAPNFNVTNVALASVTINSSTGAGTVTFALTSNNITAIADSGQAIAVALPTYDTLPEHCRSGPAIRGFIGIWRTERPERNRVVDAVYRLTLDRHDEPAGREHRSGRLLYDRG